MASLGPVGQTTAQIQAALTAAGLSSAQQAGVKAGTGYTPSDPTLSYYSAPGGGGNSSGGQSTSTPNPTVSPSTQSYLPGVTLPTTNAADTPAAPVTPSQYGTVQNGSYVGIPSSVTSNATGGAQTTPSDPTMPSTESVTAAVSQLENDSNPQNLESGSLAYQDEATAATQSLIDTLENSFNSQISQAGGNAAAASAAGGFAGSPEAGSMITAAQEPDVEARANAVSTAVLNIRSQAASDYNTFVENADTNAGNTITAWQKSQAALVANATNIWASGASPTSLQTSNPEEYNYLLQFAYNGDANVMNAAYVAANRANLMNNGQPVYTNGGNMVFAQYEGQNPDGTPNIQFTQVTDANIPQGYKMQSSNQTSQGQVINTYAPIDSNGNIVDPSSVITTLNGVQIAGPGTPAGNGIGTNPALTGQVIGGTTLGVVPNGVTATNALAAQAIMDGSAPPPSSSTGTVASNAANQQMRAYMSANGYDLTAATEDYTAVQKWQSTVDGPTFQRAVVAADSAQQYITTLQGLAETWNNNDPVNALSAANLTAALNGAYGPQQQAVAQQMTTQIADLTADMGSVYRYGLSSTDSSMENAASTLSTSWDQNQLTSSLQIISQNLQIRINSLTNPANAISASGDSGTDNSYVGSNSGSQGQDNSSTIQPAGTIVEYNGQQYTVGADGNTLTPVGQ